MPQSQVERKVGFAERIRLSIKPAEDLPVAGWSTSDGTAQQSLEEQSPRSRSPSVESEFEFLKVVLQVLPRDSSLVRREKDSMQQGEHSVDRGHDLVRFLAALRHVCCLVLVPTFTGRLPVASPVVGDNGRPGRDVLLEEATQALGRPALHRRETDPSPALLPDLDRPGHKCFLHTNFRTTAVAFVQSAFPCFINLHLSAEGGLGT
jgi:hypothetical protein